MTIKKSIKTVELTTDPDQEIILTITIGNAQIGGSVVRYKNASTIIGKGEITNLQLGPGADIIEKTLKVTTNVLDVNEQTNGIVVKYFFSGCTPAVTVFHDVVENDGDIFSFQVSFIFN